MIGRVFIVPIAITGVLSAIVVIVTSRVMPRKTHKGRIAWEQISGLEEYIRRAEIEDIQAQDRRGIFERLYLCDHLRTFQPMGPSFCRPVHPAARLVPACRPPELLDAPIGERRRSLGFLDE